MASLYLSVCPKKWCMNKFKLDEIVQHFGFDLCVHGLQIFSGERICEVAKLGKSCYQMLYLDI